MSLEAITWALKQPVTHSSAKFVLVILANCADLSMEAWPSAAYLSATTGQDRKTVLANLARLREEGWITDTGRRKGETKQVIVYELTEPPAPEEHTVDLEESQIWDSPENGTVPLFPDNSPKNGTRNPQNPQSKNIKARVREEKEKKPPKERKIATRLPRDFVPPEAWLVFANDQGFTESEAGQEWAKFRDHHWSKGTLMIDWDAGWRTWMRNAATFRADRQRRAGK